MDDIPRRVRDRPSFAPLSPEDEQEFLRKQGGFEAAYCATGDPQALCQAFLHVYASRQTPPHWVVWDILNALVEGRTDEAAERYRERIRHVQRYTVVRDLLSSDHTMTVTCALHRAEESLAQQLAAASRRTIEASYYEVKNDLDRQGRESEYFYLVELAPEAPALAPRADSTPWTTDGTIPTADTAGDTAAPVASVPWFTRIAKR